ncbi:ROK family protein [Pseudarthrobacter raffinosi]|uniref:ROK family protein n=1 Tax=Pseudarthrobacter raffinosi TaxID=2953651 RepID=UPI00208F9418|nr:MULTISPECIES: ROK family protein [unclassified Pseudarthrobacter]MCO4252014.1 ROK family protein [Pseudarthrobacter sp. MDT3-9]MCO4262840.1 ROK family protein [Pseudarthrobacter sp. MDT3-26]
MTSYCQEGCSGNGLTTGARPDALNWPDSSPHSAGPVLRLLHAGNLQAIHALRQAGRDVGDALATVVNLLNPSVIVIGGSLGQAGEHLMAGVREVVYRRSLPLATSHLRIALSMAGDQAAILGASQMVTQYVLSPAAIEATLQAAG